MDYYEEIKEAYIKLFKRLGLDVIVTEASGGVFTDKHTHEFQVLAESGEDTIYFCRKCNFGYNKEVFEGKVGEPCRHCTQGVIEEAKSIEVGNIFPLGQVYAQKMGVS